MSGTQTRVIIPGKRGRSLLWVLVAGVPLLYLLFFFLWPVIALGLKGLAPDGSIDLAGVGDVLAEQRTWRVVSQTLLQALLGTGLSVVIGVPVAFVLYRLVFRGRGVLRGLLTVPFVLPTIVVAVAFTALLREGGPFGGLGLDQSLVAIVLALAFFNVTIVARTVGGFWAGLDRRPEYAAASLGASPARVWWTITLPSLTPAIASAAALVFLFCSTSFALVLILGGRAYANIETEIYRSTILFFDLRTAAVLSLLQIVLVAATLTISTRLRKRTERSLPVHSPGTPLRKRHVPVLGVVFATMLLLHALPLVTLVLRSLSDARGGWTLEHYRNLLDPPPQTGLNVTVIEAFWLSLRSATVAATLAMILGLIVVVVLSRRPRGRVGVRAQHWYDSFVMMPIGVSAVTVGFGLLVTMRHPWGLPLDLRTSTILIPVAQSIIALPLVIRSILPVARAIDPRLRHAGATLGASPIRVLFTIDLPIISRALGLGLGFAFAVSLGEFGATSFLVRPESQTLPVVIGHLIGRQGTGNYEMGLAAATILGVITAIMMLAAERLRPKQSGEF